MEAVAEAGGGGGGYISHFRGCDDTATGYCDDGADGDDRLNLVEPEEVGAVLKDGFLVTFLDFEPIFTTETWT